MNQKKSESKKNSIFMKATVHEEKVSLMDWWGRRWTGRGGGWRVRGRSGVLGQRWRRGRGGNGDGGEGAEEERSLGFAWRVRVRVRDDDMAYWV